MELDTLNLTSWEDADNNGWHDDYPALPFNGPITPDPAERELTSEEHQWITTKLFLITSEIVEAQDELRNGKALREIYTSTGGKPEGFLTEIADVYIRLGDLLTQLGITGHELESAIDLKLGYNRKRGYKHGGKRS